MMHIVLYPSDASVTQFAYTVPETQQYPGGRPPSPGTQLYDGVPTEHATTDIAASTSAIIHVDTLRNVAR